MEINKSPVPPNVREQYRTKLQEWREDDKLYYETHNFPSIIDKVRNQTFVTFVGVPGSGKSSTAHHIALKLHEEGYEIVPTNDIKKLKDYCDPQNPQVFVIGDVVGFLGLQKTKLDALEDYKLNIKNPCMKKSKTLMTCREAVFNEILSYKPFIADKLNVVEVHSSENALNDNDKKQILKKYGLDDQKYDLDVHSQLSLLLASTSHMFPLLCKLLSKGKNFQTFGDTFFKMPVQCIMDEFDGMQRENTLRYATLVLCVMKENCLSRDDLHDEDFAKRNKDVLEKCKLESQTDTFKIEDALLEMEGTYTKQNANGQWSFIHDSIYEICAYHFGKQFFEEILECMSITYIANFVKPQTNETRMKKKQTVIYLRDKSSNANEFRSGEEDKDVESNENGNFSNDSEDSFDLRIMLCEEQYALLAQRLYKEIEDLELHDVFRTTALKHPQMCKAFINELKTKSYAELKSLFLHQKKYIEKIVSPRESILEGSADIDHWSEEREIQRLCVVESAIPNEMIPYMRVISWVIYYGHNEILKYIIEQTEKHHEEGESFMPNSALEQSRLLLLSCYSDDVKTLEMILPHVSLPSIDGTYHNDADEIEFLSPRSPLTVTCRRGHAVMANRLLKAGADINFQDRNKETPLVAACEGGHVNVVSVLMEGNANLNLHDGYGNTPLVTACHEGHMAVVELLRKGGTDISKNDNNGFRPLVTACYKGHLGIVELLLKAGADITDRDGNGYTPLVAACRDQHIGVIESLLKAGADVRESDNHGYTPLVTACREGHMGVVELLLKEGDVFRASDNNGYTPMVTACRGGHIDVAELLLKAGADMRESDDNGYTPLVTACREGHVDMVEWLLKKGADIRESDKNGYTPLVTACREGHVGVVECLLKKGADIRQRDHNGHIPLVTACYKGHVGVVELLLKIGACIRESDNKGTTPLVAACREGHESVVDKLVELGVDVNLKPRFGYTPLGSASLKGHVNIVKMLLKYGADVNQRDSKGKTALEIACKQGNKRMIDELMKALDR